MGELQVALRTMEDDAGEGAAKEGLKQDGAAVAEEPGRLLLPKGQMPRLL